MKVNKLNLIGAGASAVVCRMTMTGQILDFIQFEDVLNEMFFAFTFGMLTLGLLITSFEKVAK